MTRTDLVVSEPMPPMPPMPPGDTCNGRDKTLTSYCKRPAGWGTEHPGEGRCKLHGGASPRGVDSPHWRGKGQSPYIDVMQRQLAEKIEAVSAYDPFDISPEAALLRALLMDMLERQQSSATLKPTEAQQLIDIIERISRVVERMTRMRNDTALTAAELKLIAARLADVVARHIADADQQSRFLADLFSAIGMHAP